MIMAYYIFVRSLAVIAPFCIQKYRGIIFLIEKLINLLKIIYSTNSVIYIAELRIVFKWIGVRLQIVNAYSNDKLM